MIGFLLLALITPQTIDIQGYPGEHITYELRAHENINVYVTEPLRLLSYNQTHATISIHPSTKPGNYSQTTYLLSQEDTDIKTGIGIPTTIHIQQADSNIPSTTPSLLSKIIETILSFLRLR